MTIPNSNTLILALLDFHYISGNITLISFDGVPPVRSRSTNSECWWESCNLPQNKPEIWLARRQYILSNFSFRLGSFHRPFISTLLNSTFRTDCLIVNQIDFCLKTQWTRSIFAWKLIYGGLIGCSELFRNPYQFKRKIEMGEFTFPFWNSFSFLFQNMLDFLPIWTEPRQWESKTEK